MQINSENVSTSKYLPICLLIIGLIIVISNFFGKDVAKAMSDLLYAPVAGTTVILSLILATRFRAKGDHGKAWVIFSAFVACWFVAEQLWMLYELVYNEDPFPSYADVFYLSGYGFYLAFSFLYLRPVKTAISKKILIAACLISLTFTIPVLYLSIDLNSEMSIFDNVLAASYPIADAIVFVPAIIGMVLFFKGEVNFLWSLMCVAIVFNVVADTGFLIMTIDDAYYSGSPLDILYLWSYCLFSFGVYSHIKIFRTHSDKKRYFDLEDLR